MANSEKLSETFLSLLDDFQPKSARNKTSYHSKKYQDNITTQNNESRRQGSYRGDKGDHSGFRGSYRGGRFTGDRGRKNREEDSVNLTAGSENKVKHLEKESWTNKNKFHKRSNLESNYSGSYIKNKPSENSEASSERFNFGRLSKHCNTYQDRPAKKMGYQFLESLLNREPSFVLTTLASSRSGFQALLNELPIKADFLILIVKVLNIVNESEIHHLKMQILAETFKPEFIDEIKKYTAIICIEDNQQRLKSIGSFFENVLSLFETVINFFPSIVNEKFKSVMVALNLSIKNARDMQGIILKDNVFERLKSISDQVNAYVDNTEKIDSEKKQLSRRERFASNNFRDIPLVPTKEDFMHDNAFLRQNIVKGSYRDEEHYLDVQFRLLREDFIAPLRKGIYEYNESLSSPQIKRKYTNVRIYPKVQFEQSFQNRDTFGFLIGFDCDNKLPRHINWDYNKRFMVGSLLLFTDDHFKTFYLATVAMRDIEQLQNHKLFVAFVPGTDVPKYLFEPGAFFVMAESEVYYEAYRPVLSALQRMNQNNFPMKQYIVEVDTAPSPPVYLAKKNVYNISGYTVNVVDENSWPTPDQLKLNPSQHEAFKSALTNDFVVIQGPPGTGKTYLALKITEVLLKNNVSANCPIVVICYTNHALDQFLEGILKYTDNIIRIGSQSKNDTIAKYNIDKVRWRKRFPMSDNISVLNHNTNQEKCLLRENLLEIEDEIKKLSICKGILDLSVLKSVVTHQHYNDLKDQLVEWLMCYDFLDVDAPEEGPFVGENSKDNQESESQEQPGGVFQNDTEFEKEKLEEEMDDDENARRLSDMIQDYLVGENSNDNQESKSQEQPADFFQNVTEFEKEKLEEEMDDDENARRLADMIEDDFFEEDFFQEQIYSSYLFYSFYIANVEHDISALYNDLITCELPKNSQERFYFEKNTHERIHEMTRQVNIIQNQYLRLKDLKLNRVKFEMLQNVNSVWEMSMQDRWDYYFTWIHLYICQLKQLAQHLTKRYQVTLMKLYELRQLEDLLFVQDAAVIGLTTSGAAKRRVLLENLNNKIVIVEEAAEVLEAHIVTSLAKSVQHVILIGDHKQLRPNPAVFQLAKKYNLDVSLFERMLKNGLGCSVLGVQHRMRPEMASLIVPTIYPSLVNHPSTFDRPKVSGVDKFVFFLTHNHHEDQMPDSASRQNKFEADFLISLCQYLLLQGYQPEEITILATYAGQVWYMKKEKKRLAIGNSQWKSVRITPVDNFQGEENRIILLSLVRSNNEGRIGFLSTENRVCVALSRAKEGLYIVGNMDNLTANSAIWPKIKQQLDQINAVGRKLNLRCERHPDQLTQVESAKDFSAVPEGGCSLMCKAPLDCGHICPRVCHIIDRDHGFFKCKKPCNRLPCTVKGHKCPLHCYKPCLPCVIPVIKQLPCGHSGKLLCHKEPASALCQVLVPVTLPICGHSVDKPCFMDINECRCSDACTFRLPCGHACVLKCHVTKDPDHLQYKCMKKCDRPNVGCRRDHACSKVCYQPCGDCEVSVLTKLPCGHSQEIFCSADESKVQCKKPCKNTLPCEHKCRQECWLPCNPDMCEETVDKVGECGHTFKKIKCNTGTDTLKCREACKRLLPCGHGCPGKCFSDCTDLCQVSVKSLVLPACNHQPVQIPCHLNKPELNPGSDELLQLCKAPCGDQLMCGHQCKGTCGNCLQGRLHMPCEEKCNIRLICGHQCKGKCNELCPPCSSKDCFNNNCSHHRCNRKHLCSQLCIVAQCTRPCVWKCVHQKCRKQCGQECDRSACDEPCTYELKCGHLCVGYCGERHPPLCQVCDSDHDAFLANPLARLVVLEDCNHVIESRQLVELVATATRSIIFKQLKCPQCEKPIVKTMRCRNIYIRFRTQVNKISRLVNEETIRLKKINTSNLQLLKSSPTSSQTMNQLLMECSQFTNKNFRGQLARQLMSCLLQPLATRCQQLKKSGLVLPAKFYNAPRAKLDKGPRALSVKEEERLRLRLEYLAGALRLRLDQISYSDILQIELEVARLVRALETSSLIDCWYDVTKYTWARDSTLRLTNNLHPLPKISSTLRTRDDTREWYECDKEHWYVSENGEPCVTCRDEEKEQRKVEDELKRAGVSRLRGEGEGILERISVSNYRQKARKRWNGGSERRDQQSWRQTLPTPPTERDIERQRMIQGIMKDNNEGREKRDQLTKTILEEYLGGYSSVNDVRQEIEQMFPANRMGDFVEKAMVITLEKKAGVQSKIGLLISAFMDLDLFTVEVVVDQLSTIYESAEDIAIDFPKVWELQAHILVPVFAAGKINFSHFKAACRPVLKTSVAARLLVPVLTNLVDEKGAGFVKKVWDSSNVCLKDFLPAGVDSDAFIKDNSLEFLTGEAPQYVPRLFWDKFEEEMLRLMRTNQPSEKVVNFISSTVGEKVRDLHFIRALVTAFCEACITGPNHNLDTRKFKQFEKLIQKYLDSKEVRELACLSSVHNLSCRLQHPQGLIKLIFYQLMEDNVISYQSFLKWREDDEEKLENKYVSLYALTSFYAGLDEEDSDNDYI